jgi:4-hydroxy-2-oxoheptanedioate aldolase
VSLAPNEFKRRLADPADRQIGVFVALADPIAAEISAGAGFDVVVVDAEHGPNDLRTVLGQLQAIVAGGAEAAVRVVDADPARIKQILDLGARTLVVPMIESAVAARDAVSATRYAPDGIRGLASARAARWGRVEGYHASAADELCVVVQVESIRALSELEAICAVEGVDAVFVGPMDLAASMGLAGGATHPEVVAVVVDAIERIARSGRAPAVMASTPELTARYASAGARFLGVGVDTAVLAAATSALAAGSRAAIAPTRGAIP